MLVPQRHTRAVGADNNMFTFVAILGLALAGMVYVYRFRGATRYGSLSEYFSKGWPVFSPLNCLLYLTTRARGSRAILDPALFPELDVLRENWQTIRDEAEE